MILAGALAVGRPPTKPAPSPPPVLEGTVKGPDSRPIEKALVIVRDTGARYGDPPLAARTDGKGHFAVTLAGSYPVRVRVEAPGLAPGTLEHVRAGAPLSITLESGRTIEGVVRDAASRQPVSGARVEARTGGGLTWEPESG
ncbi:MAG TPA: carboxypeptidase-like regulatory domain-containing protein, partial [Vicinamibacteria bacterium]|nr:carboxypeptidase-like regulatory domain-containing protein [Vicinamibacteria bacterium]